METAQTHQINMERQQDIRQSDGWGKYLEAIGWKTRRTSNGILIAIRSSFIGNFVKIQHPRKIEKEDLEEIENICRGEKCAYIKIEPDHDQDLAVFEGRGYRPTYSPNCVPSTIFMDLTGTEDDMWAEFSHSAKYSINRAVREGYTVTSIKKPTEERLKESYELFRCTAKKKNFYMSPFREFLIRVDFFGGSSYLCEVRNKDGELQSSKFCLGHKNMVLFVSGGSSEAARKNKSGYLLMWETMKFLKGEGYEVFDLEGKYDERFPFQTRNWEGFSHFKEKFGGTAVEFPIPRIKFLSRIYGVASKLMKVDF
ncbi:MAG: hypothetical protein UV00_C0014G0020 [candidate division WWE3 bacterium GW2011_GWF1_42_14]|jgi:hypothetical protein|uniref:BioF2-like acetyltransferase domain-containing protein n=1 Tax=candidate division WWE3 bacterium GW2011_GWF1_42_14 TaxID=1619138 RepID=A0A0G0YLB7_UNCKA|nr:MAG: hypothetical protein UV00_C0014G0020 [candidate division WWE3 bacterium GW2011_GWF1_42_14]